MIPVKKSNKWLGVFLLYILVVLISFIATRVILDRTLSVDYVVRLLIISLGSAILPCLCGYFGKRVFFLVYTLSVIIGIVSMFYIVIADTSPGWGDLSSIVSYVLIIGIGILLALIAEVIAYFINARRK
jgi:hypothetical protein